MLQRFVADGSMHALSGTAFAVTPTLRESYAEGDDDELAEVALREAALASLRLLGAEEIATEPFRRDGWCWSPRWPKRQPRPDLDDAVVRLAGPVGIADVIAAYVDNAVGRAGGDRCGRGRRRRRLGDEDAELTVGDAQDHDLAWYATQELPFLLELL